MRLILALILIWLIAPHAQATPVPARVTVHLFESHAAANRLNVEGPFQIINPRRSVPAGKYFFEATGQEIHLRSEKSSSPFHLDAKTFSLTGIGGGVAIQYSTSKPRRYAGILKVYKDRLNLRVENVVNTRDYIMSVVGSESDRSFPLESLKAQAILTQTRVVQMRPGDVVGDSTQEESYFGTEYVSPTVKSAVDAVWGNVLTYQNQPIHIFYHSTCAGKTSAGTDVFGDAAKSMPYLKCVQCDHCRASPFWKPTVTSIPRKDFLATFATIPTIETLDCAKRPSTLTFKSNGKTKDLSGYQFWIQLGQKFGWGKAPGTRYKFLPSSESLVNISSTGAGHGVGMCQWGAAGLAESGKTGAEILQFYFPGTKIKG